MKKLIVIFFLLTSLVAFGQNKELSLDGLFANRALYPKSLANLQWVPNTTFYTWIGNDALIRTRADNGTTDTILTLRELRNIAKKVFISENKLQSFPAVTWLGEDMFYLTIQRSGYIFIPSAKKLELIYNPEEGDENEDLNPKSLYTAFTRGNNLFVRKNLLEFAITADPDTGIVNGQSVHRNEWGIEKGTFWSPDGLLLAFYRMDQSMVTEYPVADISTTPASRADIRYPMAGMNSHRVTLGIYNTITLKTTFLQTGEPADQYLTNVCWAPDGKSLYVVIVNRDQDHLWLNRYRASDGAFEKTLFEEKNEKYVEPLHPMVFFNSRKDMFIWQSARNGFNHLYLYDTSGRLVRQLTQGSFTVTGYLGTDNKDRNAFFLSTITSPLEEQLCCVSTDKAAFRKITGTPGTHQCLVNSNGMYVLDRRSAGDMACEYQLLDITGKTLRTLLTDANPLSDYTTGKTRIFTIPNQEGTDLYCRMILPPGFDSTKQYPVIIYVYGGPHSQLITNSWLWGAGMFLNYLATKGYIVFTLDNRGTKNRGLAFEQAIYRNLGQAEVQDQMCGVKYLISKPYVDKNRMGVHGWSYGGFLTLSMLLDHPGVFKAGVAGGPVTDWKYYEVMYGERYMDTPEQNPQGYSNAALQNRVKNLNSRLLIIHGTVDPTVVWQNSLQFLKSCVDNGVLLDYFVYPGHEHNVSGKDRKHLYRKIEDYFSRNL